MQPVSLNRSGAFSSLRSAPDWALQLLHRATTGRTLPTDRLWIDPAYLLRRAGMTADPWQLQVLNSPAARLLLLCSRQVGKTTVVSALALKVAILEAPSLVLIVCPSERQSGEFMQKVKAFYAALRRKADLAGRPQSVYETLLANAGKDGAYLKIPEKLRESALQLHLKNGSRIIGLPAAEATVRGYSGVNLLVIDEAARVPDALYRTVRPMLATSRGRLVALTTPFGKRGWFFEEWTGPGQWERVSIAAKDCPRITPEFLEEERLALGGRWFEQEYFCSFEDLAGSVFSHADIQAALSDTVAPLFGGNA